MGKGARYVCRKKIADGGMAEIFVATQTGAEGFSRTVILKRILPALSADPQFRDMLVDEAHIAMSLNHGNIVPVLDLGQAEGRPFLVMELVDGWDLSAVVRRAAKAELEIPVGLALYLMAEVCRGLAFAHAQVGPDGRARGIVHRDVSPHNVLLGAQGEVKLTDFGIAKALGKRDRTRTGVIKGKLDFMSPEQASGESLDALSDVFAAGTILYLLLTGRRPFEGTSDLEVLLKVRRGEAVPVARARPDLPARVAAIVTRAMQQRPADRYPGAEAMMLDLEAVLRADFPGAGQSALKRWLEELARRDGAPPAAQRPALPVDEPLGPLAVDGSGTVDLEESVIAAGMAETVLANTGSTTVARKRPARGRLGPAVARAARSAVTLAVLAAVAFAAWRLVPPRTRASAIERVRAVARVADLEGIRSAFARVGRPPRDSVATAPPPPARRPEPITKEVAEPLPTGAPVRKEGAPSPGGRRRPPTSPASGRGDRATVHVVSRPSGVRVLRGNAPIGRTPLRLSLRPGNSETLRFVKPGYAPTTRRITTSPRTVVVELRRKR